MGNSPLMAMALFAAYQAFNGAFKVLFLIIVQTPTSIAGGCEQFRSVPKFKRATRVGSRAPSWRSRSHGNARRPNENATYRERLDNPDTRCCL
jgi:hypothetical protein